MSEPLVLDGETKPEGYTPGDAMLLLKQQVSDEEFHERAAEYWRDHPEEKAEVWHEQVFVPMVMRMKSCEGIKFDRGLRRRIIRYRRLPIVNGVVQGWYIFETITSDGIPIEVLECLADERGWTLDVAGFEERMEEHRQESREKSKPMGLKSAN